MVRWYLPFELDSWVLVVVRWYLLFELDSGVLVNWVGGEVLADTPPVVWHIWWGTCCLS